MIFCQKDIYIKKRYIKMLIHHVVGKLFNNQISWPQNVKENLLKIVFTSFSNYGTVLAAYPLRLFTVYPQEGLSYSISVFIVNVVSYLIWLLHAFGN